MTDGRQIFKIIDGTKIADFLKSTRPVDVLCGPLGSGKTKALCARPMRHAQEQKPSIRDGLRYTRFAMVRNTVPDLKRTTIRSWRELYPEHIYGPIRTGSPMGCEWKFGDIRCEIDFIGLDRDEDVRKLRSGEYTAIFFDELEFIEKMLFDEARSRLRYPSEEHGGATWRGVCAATNAPPEDHWLPMMTGMVDLPPGLTLDEIASLKWPESWGFHLQPAALIENIDQHGNVIGYRTNPKAENIENLPKKYYEDMLSGQTKAWIDSRLMVRTVLVTSGSPVHPQFRREVHVAQQVLRPRAGYPVIACLDFGRTPACLFIQVINDRVQFQYEVIGQNESAALFAPRVKRFFNDHYPEHDIKDVIFYGDPKGQDKGQADERTAFEVFGAFGMTVRPPPGLKQNMIATRVGAMDALLTRMVDGKPAFVSSPMCRTFNVGMAGRYCNERDEQGELRPCKNRYSHVVEAGHYGVLGVGEGRRMVGLAQVGDMKPIQTYHRRQSMRRVSA